jgi:PAS domain S-box-containing protein
VSEVDRSEQMWADGDQAGASDLVTGLAVGRVLVTDDRPEAAEAIESALGVRYECEFVNLGQARVRLARRRFDLVLCDLEIGGEEAIDLAEEIVNDDSDTVVVLVTEQNDPELTNKIFGAGAHDYVVKPVLPGQLLITVMNALRRRELDVGQRERSRNLTDRRQTIIDMAPIAIYAKDADGHYIVANEKADELAGLKPGELLGMTDGALLAPDELAVSIDSDQRVIEEKAAHEREDTVEIGGATKTFKTVRFPLLDERGEVSAVGGVSVEITAEREAIRLRDELADAQRNAIEELRLSRLETIEGLAKAIDLHDSPTGEHVLRMAAIAAFVATRLGIDHDHVELMRAAAPMHDVGKIGTPAEILRKPGPLTETERTEMQRHTVVGHQIFAHFESELSRLAASIALTHHERYDGGGYPNGLIGEAIPLEGRIAAVADVFDALLSECSYRQAMSVEEAVAVMREGRGTHFDPRVVDVVLDDLPHTLALRG